LTAWFEDADPAYPDWLADHPDGFVLDTYVRPSAGRLVLHRAGCPRVSRPLAPRNGKAARFGKACADTPAELRAWAAEQVGAEPRSCGLCGGDDG
jgi:hypothetical protein